MFPKPVSALLLPNKSFDLLARFFAQHDIGEPMRRAAQFNQISKVSTRRGERYSYSLSPPRVRAGLIHCLSNSFCHPAVALPRFCGRYLQRNCVESLVIAVGAALQHRKDSLRT